MVYFKAIELKEKPFIQWDSVAFSLQELQDLKLEDDPLVLAEDKIPTFQFGVCPLKIEDGQLVKRTLEEMDKYAKEYAEISNQREKQTKRDILQKLLSEINLSKDLGESTKEFEDEYKIKKSEYLTQYPI